MTTKGTSPRRPSLTKNIGKQVLKLVKSSSFSTSGNVKTSNRNSDLHALALQFDVVKSKLELFITALKEQHSALVQINKTRLSVRLTWFLSLVADMLISSYVDTFETWQCLLGCFRRNEMNILMIKQTVVVVLLYFTKYPQVAETVAALAVDTQLAEQGNTYLSVHQKLTSRQKSK